MEETIVMFKECLFQSFYDWLLRHREIIGDKHYGKLLDDLKKAWDLSDTAVKLIGIAMWSKLLIVLLWNLHYVHFRGT